VRVLARLRPPDFRGTRRGLARRAAGALVLALDIRAIRAEAAAGMVFVDVVFAGNFERLAGRGHLKRAVAGIVFVKRGRKGRVMSITGRGRTRARLGRGATGVAFADGRTLTFAMQGFDPRRARELAVATFAPGAPARRRARASITEALLELFLFRTMLDQELVDSAAVPDRQLNRMIEQPDPAECDELRKRRAELSQYALDAQNEGLDVQGLTKLIDRVTAALVQSCGEPPPTPPAPPPSGGGGGEPDGDRLEDHLVPGGGANQIAPANSLYFTTDQAQPRRVGLVSAAGVGPQFNVPDPGGSPQGITFGPDGNAWFAESVDDEVVRMTPLGVFTEFPIPPGSLGRPIDIAAGPDGKLWYVEQTGDRIVSITTDGATQTPYSLDGGSGPTTITPGPDGRLWFTRLFDNEIGAIDPATGDIDDRGCRHRVSASRRLQADQDHRGARRQALVHPEVRRRRGRDDHIWPVRANPVRNRGHPRHRKRRREGVARRERSDRRGDALAASRTVA
jgi:hypothetical protein